MTADSKIKVGVLGCGRIAQLAHLKALVGNPSVAVAALADADAGRRDQAADFAPDAAQCSDYSEVLSSREIDAVVICLPPALHARVAIEAFTAGKHVYLEKPVATNLADAEQVCRAWRASGKAGMIGFNFRFNDLYLEAKRHLQSGTLGQLVAARSVFSAAARPLPMWKRSKHSGGGVLLDLASHHADIARFLFDEEISTVRATILSQRCEGDTALVEMHTHSGIPIQSFFSMSAIEEHSFAIYGQKGRLSFDRLSPHVQITRPTQAYDTVRRVWDSFAALGLKCLLRNPSEPSFAASLDAFVNAVRDNKQAKPDLDDGYRSLAIVAAAGQSLASGRFVELTQLAGVVA